MISVGLTAVLLLAFAYEGILCIVMAMPIVTVCAAIGAAVGWYLQRRIPPNSTMKIAPLFLIAFLIPLGVSADAILPIAAPMYEVRTSLIINARPAAVWKNVIRFPDIPAPTEALFYTGIAYPIRATIIGSGIGAIRYCEFSTGKFVEPITRWDPNHLLAFNVAHSPEPMREWSPYGALETPHLHGYMTSRHGQFLLESLPGGKTRLTGTTWYQHHLWPARYWALWSDAIVHSIHKRVLTHIKHVSEQA